MVGDESQREMLERILETGNAASLRELVRARLDLHPAESVVSIGCGPGYETRVLAEDIGPRGHVLGVDADREVLAGAAERCAAYPQVSFAQGDATRLPVRGGSYEVAVAKQVYQFVPDIDAALSELYRVLEPGGRAAVVEKDVDARVIHSTDPERMRRAQAAYRDAVAHPKLGTWLRSALPDAGFAVEAVVPTPRIQTEITEQVEQGIAVHRRFMAADGSFDRAEIDAWERDLRDLDDAGEFLSCGTQFLYIARREE